MIRSLQIWMKTSRKVGPRPPIVSLNH